MKTGSFFERKICSRDCLLALIVNGAPFFVASGSQLYKQASNCCLKCWEKLT